MLQKIINTGLLACVLFLFSFHSLEDGLKAKQLKNDRVKTAYRKKWPALQALLRTKQVAPDDFDIYLRAFKQEGTLEIWAKNKRDTPYTLLKTTAICATSGSLGPKRRQGDGQVPEGFYEITALNPYSSYHLSLKVGYPNKSDALKANGDPGGDIMIHGYCVTIGCIPIENEPIEELYVLCLEAKNRKRTIRADIYPYRFDEKKQDGLEKKYSEETRLFWNNLKKGYTYFELNRRLPAISTGKTGDYIIEKPGV